jgi:hypothetical protein
VPTGVDTWRSIDAAADCGWITGYPEVAALMAGVSDWFRIVDKPPRMTCSGPILDYDETGPGV